MSGKAKSEKRKVNMGEARERPVIMTGESVRAILAGHKTQTRRVVNPQPPCPCGVTPEEMSATTREGWQMAGHSGRWWCPCCTGDWRRACPFGKPGDRLWVKEAAYIAPCHFVEESSDLNNCTDTEGRRRCVGWAASMDGDAVRCAEEFGVWKRSPMLMPRWACRLVLEVVRVRVERVQEISGADIAAEGITDDQEAEVFSPDGRRAVNGPRGAFAAHWNALNARRGFGWYEANPWVWVVEFKRVDRGGGA